VPGYPPAQPLNHLQLLERSHSLGVDVVQVADNLPLGSLSQGALDAFAERAQQLMLRVEVGTRGIDGENLKNYLSLASLLGSPILRIVIAQQGREVTPAEAITSLKPHRKTFEAVGVRLAIENHERFTTDELITIVTELGTDWVGICLDTVNSFGALEGPAVVVDKLAPFTINLHVKDFAVRRAEHMMGFTIEGAPVGQGQLDVPWLVETLGGPGRDISAIIELWTPPEKTVEATVQKEAEWAEVSVRYLKNLFGAPSGLGADLPQRS
jgi:3-oxoisoapionate decarboxylase